MISKSMRVIFLDVSKRNSKESFRKAELIHQSIYRI
jgi:hypothetical protein